MELKLSSDTRIFNTLRTRESLDTEFVIPKFFAILQSSQLLSKHFNKYSYITTSNGPNYELALNWKKTPALLVKEISADQRIAISLISTSGKASARLRINCGDDIVEEITPTGKRKVPVPSDMSKAGVEYYINRQIN